MRMQSVTAWQHKFWIQPISLMDEASASEAGDARPESWAGQRLATKGSSKCQRPKNACFDLPLCTQERYTAECV